MQDPQRGPSLSLARSTRLSWPQKGQGTVACMAENNRGGRFVGMKRTLGLMLLVLALPARSPAQSLTFAQRWKPVADEFHALLGREGVVGGSLWFLHGRFGSRAGVPWPGRSGNRAGKVDANTIFHWASITKTMTAIAIMQLRDRGRLSLDDPIVKYVPELMAVHNPYGPMEAITIRHLLSHSAGFRNPTWPWGGDQPWHPFEPTQWAQLVAMMPYTEILFPPGSKYSYSNPGIMFLGRTIEKLSGDDFEVYITKNILMPLGMTHSYFDVSPYHLVSERSNNYEVRDGKTVANGLDFDTGITVSNGGLNAPITDMAKYLGLPAGQGSRRERPGAGSQAKLAGRALAAECCPVGGCRGDGRLDRAELLHPAAGCGPSGRTHRKPAGIPCLLLSPTRRGARR